MQSVDDHDSLGSRFYRAAVRQLIDAQIPFLVGGAYALEVHTGIVRRTKDFDIFMVESDVRHALQVLSQAGYKTELTFPHWIAKSFCGDDFIDIIFNSGNGVCPVDDEWFRYALQGDVLGMSMQLCPAEETIWQKSYILERDRCDVADVAHLLRHCGQRLDWERLLRRFGPRWRVLLGQLLLFDFVYPSHRDQVPPEVRQHLTELLKKNIAETADDPQCHGTLLSATQYLHDVDLEGYADGRVPPLGNVSPEHIAIWTANFMKPN